MVLTVKDENIATANVYEQRSRKVFLAMKEEASQHFLIPRETPI